MALNYFAPGLGAVYSGAIGAGIGTLVQGGSMKDAFKAALVGGATGALAAGVSGPNSGAGGFMDNISADITTGNASISSAFSGDFAPLQGSILPSVRDLDANPNNDFNANLSTESKFDASMTDQNILYDGTKTTDLYRPTQNFSDNIKKETMFDKMGDYAIRGGDTVGEVASRQSLAQTNAIQKSLTSSKSSGLNINAPAVQKAALDAGDAAFKAAGTSAIAKYGPSVALATAAGAAGGIFDAPEEEPMEETRTGMDVYNENADLYNVANLTPQYITGDPSAGSSYPYYVPQAAAAGGEIFPRRVGGIMPDEGIPDKDSVRAMLMPGEFVMTTDAVKGLGGGNMNKGINNMYGVMRNLEQRGRAVA